MKHCMAKLSVVNQSNTFLKNKLLEAAHKSGLSVLNFTSHEFHPHGLTAIVVLAESHLAIHTYPELNLIYMDAFTCGDIPPSKPVEIFTGLVNGGVFKIETVDRS